MASSVLPSRTFHPGAKLRSLCLLRLCFHRHPFPSSAPYPLRETCVPCCLPGAVSRWRAAVQLLSTGFLTAVLPPPLSLAARRGRIVVPPEDYATALDGLKYYDLVQGKGPTAEKGSTVQVHFDCIYRGITAVSSRESELLAGNRSIAHVMRRVPADGAGSRDQVLVQPAFPQHALHLQLLASARTPELKCCHSLLIRAHPR
ncbi:uncharacterized protein LOC120647645 [Panicum virgatum]|uniref:uncharacterized protein LOC120647645 n=1 Tax=Panicum virgatum TaxID=38727 RepID=UPI0019D61830|nr:uncharacterized protein LOC120647645 [Panicum virgatum]